MKIKPHNKSLKLLIITLLIIFSFSTKTFSLGWNSKEWLNASCKNNILGTWVPESYSKFSFSNLKIEKQSIQIAKNKSLDYRIEHKGITDKNGWKYIELKTRKLEPNASYPNYLKVRPHLTRNKDLSKNRLKKGGLSN